MVPPTDAPPVEKVDPYQLHDGIYIPSRQVLHREEEYDSRGFLVLKEMQRDHFWYRGRRRFLLHAVDRHLGRLASTQVPRQIVDLGGGCGGWIAYLVDRGRFPDANLALADSSGTALRFAAEALPKAINRYQIDLLNLQWKNRWDIAFLLDVLEHIPDHEQVLREIHDALNPGGLLFITVPALNIFWSWHDELAHHQRRYRRSDFPLLADRCGFHLLETRYFMFFLSPLLLASRLAAFAVLKPLERGKWRTVKNRMQRVPNRLVNSVLAAIFASETPLGHILPFPWGTSVLAVLEKPRIA
jgi:SAM-dependent methyltransferase